VGRIDNIAQPPDMDARFAEGVLLPVSFPGEDLEPYYRHRRRRFHRARALIRDIEPSRR
jgi:hypothetical protein